VKVAEHIGNPISYPSSDFYTNRNIFSYGSYIGQQIFPGEYLCLIGGAHTVAKADLDGQTLGYATNEPVAQNCMPISFTMASPLEIGLISDPLVEELQKLEKVDQFYPPRHGADAVLGSVNLFGVSLQGTVEGYKLKKAATFKHILLISRYKRRSIANGSHINEGELRQTLDDLQRFGVVDKHRPSYLLLFEKYDDLEAIRNKFLEQGATWKHVDGIECFRNSILYNRSHLCFESIVKGEFLDVLIPANIETYVSFRVTVNGAPEIVRVGTSLAAILARELPMTSDWKKQDYNAAAPEHYNSNVKLERFIDGHAVEIDFSTVHSFSDYSIPLQAGDVISWR